MSKEYVNPDLASRLPRLPDGYRWKVSKASGLVGDMWIEIQAYKKGLIGYRWKSVNEIGVLGGFVADIFDFDDTAIMLRDELNSKVLEPAKQGIYGVTKV